MTRGADEPGPEAPAAEPLLEMRTVMARLRRECAWKSAQTHRSLVRHLIEEAHEVADAVDGLPEAGPDPLREELGDLLLQVYFHAAIAQQEGGFTIDDVAAGIVAKLRRRNPHVFADGPAPTDPATVNEVWEQVKAAEKPRRGVTDGLPPTLPALLYADKVLGRLARWGADAPAAQRAPAPGSAAADDAARQVGERLLAVLEESRGRGVDPEQALRDAVRQRLGDI